MLFLVALAIGTYRSRDLTNPDLGFVASLARQGVDASVSAAQEVRGLIPGTSAAAAQQSAPQAVQPRSTAADLVRQPIVPEPAQSVPPTLWQKLGCDGIASPSVVALNQQTLTTWLTRAGGFPRANLAAFHQPSPGLSTPPACISADRTRAAWLVTFGDGRYQALVAHFDPNQNYLRHDSLQPIALH